MRRTFRKCILVSPFVVSELQVRDGPFFSRGGGGGGKNGFLGGRKFFHNQLSTCNFFPPLSAQNFFKLPKSRIRGVVSADNFFQMHLGGGGRTNNLFHHFFSWKQFFPNHNTTPPLPGKNNGPSLIKVEYALP